MNDQKFIYHMYRVQRIVPPKREILKNISLSFFPGAKIGVVGPNGSGKSSLLRIMAGVDQEYLGEAWAAKGTRIAYLPQEPELDSRLDVKGNVEQAVRHLRNLLERFDQVSARFADVTGDEEMTALIDEQAALQDSIDAAGAWDLDRKIEIAMDALRLPPAARGRLEPLRWENGGAWPSVGFFWRSPICSCWTSLPTTSTPSRWRGWSTT